MLDIFPGLIQLDIRSHFQKSSAMSADTDNAKQTAPTVNLNDENVMSYLRSHPESVEKYVMEEVDLELLEKWVIRRTKRSRKADLQVTRRCSLSRWKFCVHSDKRAMLEQLTASIHRTQNETRLLEEFSKCIASAVNADHHNLYLLGPDGLTLYDEDNKDASGDQSQNLRTAQIVANTLEPVRVSARDNEHDQVAQESAYHSLFQPISRSDGELVGVIQLCKDAKEMPFYEEDEEIVSSYLAWGGVALNYAQLHTSVKMQRELHEFLLEVVRSIFQDVVTSDILVRKIINFAQHLVKADRASLFLLDSEKKELCAKLFDNEEEEETCTEENSSDKEIRLPVGVGIAGYVAQTKQLVNVPDAYKDPRFNSSVDKKTGYKTKSILCMPILKSTGQVIGVVQMVNKKTGTFTKEDESNFEMFAVYCALALNHAELFEKIKQSEQKYKVALEVLSYHSTCSESEVKQLLPVMEEIVGLDRYDLNFMSTTDMEKAKCAVYMFKDLFGLTRFNTESVVRFTLTVCKNYRRVPYHNWTHGFSVANAMYAILKHSPGLFEEKERLALFIAALCHDLDHRGKNNKFMIESASPLANMYTTSTLEHHHFNQTVAILQQEGHNVLEKLERDEYKQVLEIIKHCILATDLALFFDHKTKLSSILTEGEFTFSNPTHRSLVMAIAMTASDLSASAKPWDIQMQTVKVIFEEFYLQGDEERRAGREPIPMMDRNKPERQAASQVEFLSGICIPCYTLLSQIVPGSEPLLKECRKNLEIWKQVSSSVKDSDDILGIANIKVD